MTSPALTLIPDAEEQAFAAAIDCLGDERFLPALLHWAHLALGASDGSLIRHGGRDAELTATVSIQGQAARDVGAWYMRGAWYLREPNLAATRAAPGVLQITQLARDELPDPRWREQYQRTRLAERLSLLVPLASPMATPEADATPAWVFFNAYRPQGCALPLAQANAALQRRGPALAAVVRRHLALRPVSPFEGLSVRERQVIDAVLAGQSAKESARDLGLSPTSIATYRQRAFEKLGINRQVQLFQLAQTFRR